MTTLFHCWRHTNHSLLPGGRYNMIHDITRLATLLVAEMSQATGCLLHEPHDRPTSHFKRMQIHLCRILYVYLYIFFWYQCICSYRKIHRTIHKCNPPKGRWNPNLRMFHQGLSSWVIGCFTIYPPILFLSWKWLWVHTFMRTHWRLQSKISAYSLMLEVFYRRPPWYHAGGTCFIGNLGSSGTKPFLVTETLHGFHPEWCVHSESKLQTANDFSHPLTWSGTIRHTLPLASQRFWWLLAGGPSLTVGLP